MTKIMITTRVYNLYEQGYGSYRRTGSPTISHSFTDFPTTEEAQAAVDKINSRKSSLSESMLAEIL